MKTEDEYLEFTKNLIETQTADLLTKEFQPSITFHMDSDNFDAPPRLIFFPQLDGDPQSRSKVGWALQVLAAGIDNLWTIAFVVDTWHCSQMTKHDGTEWGYGDMQHAFLNKTVDADLVYEAFTYQIVDVEGQMAMVSVPYTRHETEVEFHWDKAKVGIEGGEDAPRFAGFFPDAMRSAVRGPKLLTEMLEAGLKYEDLNLDLDRARIHTMAVACKMVMQRVRMPVLIPCHSEEEQEIIQHSMNGGPFSEGLAAYSQDDLEEIVALEEALEQPSANPNK